MNSLRFYLRSSLFFLHFWRTVLLHLVFLVGKYCYFFFRSALWLYHPTPFWLVMFLLQNPLIILWKNPCIYQDFFYCDIFKILYLCSYILYIYPPESTYLCYITPAVQLCPTLCNPMDDSPPGSSVHDISQAKLLERVAISSSKVLQEPEIEPMYFVSLALTDGSFPLGHLASPMGKLKNETPGLANPRAKP